MVVGLEIGWDQLAMWNALADLAQKECNLQFWCNQPPPVNYSLPLASDAKQVDIWLFNGLLHKQSKKPYLLWFSGEEQLFRSSRGNGLRGSWKHWRLGRWLKGAQAIATPTERQHQFLQHQFNIPLHKLHLLAPGLPTQEQPVDTIKEQWGGNEFFLATGPHLLTALKAFSIFKKRQQSSWKLVLLSDVGEAESVLEGYKYKNEVVVLPLAMAHTVLPAAYALLSAGSALWWHPIVVSAWQAGVPVIAEKNTIVAQKGGAAVRTVEGSAPEAFADALMQLYKDEGLHQELSESAVALGQQWSSIETERSLKAFLAAGAPTFVAPKKNK